MAERIRWHEAHDRKSIKNAITSKYDAYTSLQGFFKYIRDNGKSVFVLNPETGNFEFTPEMRETYSAIFEKLGEIESSAVKTDLEGAKLTKEAKRIKGVVEAIEKEQVELLFANADGSQLLSDAAMSEKVFDQLAQNRKGRTARKTTRGTMKDKYTSAMRGVLLKSYFPHGLDGLSDKEVVEAYEKMRLHVARLGKASDMVKSNLLQDKNYPRYVESKNMMTRKTRRQIKKATKTPGRLKSAVSGTWKKVSNFFTNDSKMLKMVQGKAPISDEYLANASAMWLKLFNNATVTKAAIEEEISRIESETAPVIAEGAVPAEVVEEAPAEGPIEATEEVPEEAGEELVEEETAEVDEATAEEVEEAEDVDFDILDANLMSDEEVEDFEKEVKCPSGISNLAADALWADIYCTVSPMKNSDGRPKIGSRSLELLEIASGRREVDALDKPQQQRVKEILTNTYKNHAQYMLGSDVATLQEELKTMGIDLDLTKYSGENQQEQMAEDIAKAKYGYYENAGLSPRGWSRLALFELSQGKYNMETGEKDPRRESQFYRALREKDLVFDLNAYQEKIEETVNAQIEAVGLTNPEGPPKAQVQILGEDGVVVDALAVDINGVNCYVEYPPTTPPKVLETDTIDQTSAHKLVNLDVVVSSVSLERELNKAREKESTRLETSRASGDQKGLMTGANTGHYDAPTM